MTPRPAESIQAVVAAIIGAVLIIYGALKDGFQFEDLQDPEVTGAITVLVGLVAALVTWYIARRQRDGELPSSRDGTVQ
jgi:ABC-type Fe3+-siderophore transport system permease subunit